MSNKNYIFTGQEERSIGIHQIIPHEAATHLHWLTKKESETFLDPQEIQRLQGNELNPGTMKQMLRTLFLQEMSNGAIEVYEWEQEKTYSTSRDERRAA